MVSLRIGNVIVNTVVSLTRLGKVTRLSTVIVNTLVSLTRLVILTVNTMVSLIN